MMKGDDLMTFSEFLNLDSIGKIQVLLGRKLYLYEKIYIKWWMGMKELNPHLKGEDLYESIRKSRF